ncbi:potassium transporter, partial [Moniliophthora roreri]
MRDFGKGDRLGSFEVQYQGHYTTYTVFIGRASDGIRKSMALNQIVGMRQITCTGKREIILVRKVDKQDSLSVNNINKTFALDDSDYEDTPGEPPNVHALSAPTTSQNVSTLKKR